MLPVIRPSPGHDIQPRALHRRDGGRDGAHPEAPTVHVRAFSVLGTVNVWRVPHDMRGGYGDIFRQLEERQRQLPS